MMTETNTPRTMFQKIWDANIVYHEEGQPAILYVDLHLIHEVTSAQAFEGLRMQRRKVRRPELSFATPDHNVPTVDRLLPIADPLESTERSFDPQALNDTNQIELRVLPHPSGHVLLMATLDNLGKGASGVAMQNLNLMLGLDESAGLPS